MATGKFGNDEDFRQVSSQNAEIAVKAISYTAKRRNQLDGRGGKEAWSADKIAEGQAIDSVQNEIKQQGVFNALKKEKQSDDDAFRQAVMGSEFVGRKSENELLGIGKEWTKRTATGDDIKTMSKVQDNAAVAALGGIDATHAELMKHGGVHGAIRDMVTQAQKKGIDSAADAKTLRKKYDTDHDGDIDDDAAVVSDSQRSAAMESKKNALKKLNDKISNGGFDMSDKKEKAEFERLSNTVKSADATINNRDKMGLSEQAELIANQKLESQLGQAEGIKKNINGGGVNYAQNAMYSEMSKQQSTAAKIDAQGGVDAAVRTDTTESAMKATQQQQALLGATQQYLQSAAGGSHSKKEAQRMARAIMEGGKGAAEFLKQAMSGAGALAFAQSAGKTASDISKVETANEKFKNGGFVGFMKDSAAVSTAGDVKKLNLSEDPHDSQERADSYIKRKVGKSTGKEAQKARNEAIESLHEAGLTDKNGKAVSGVKGAIAFSEATAGTMNKDVSMMIGKDRVRFSQNASTGETLANIDGSTSNKQGDSDITDNSSTLKKWGNRDVAKTLLIASGNKNPTDEQIDQLAGNEQFMSMVQKGNFGKAMASGGMYNFLKSNNLIPQDMNENQFGANLDMAVTAGSIPAATAVEMGLEKAFLAGNGNRVATKDFTFNTGKVDKDGNPVTVTKKAGDEFNIKDIPENQRNTVKEASRVQDTKVTKMAKGAWGEFTEVFRKSTAGKSIFNSENNPVNSTTKSGNYQDKRNPDEKVSDKPHESSLNKDTNSVPKNGETSKSAAAKQKIDNIQERMSNLSKISDADLGRQNLVAKIDDALEGATDPKERKALNQLKNDVLDGKSIDKRAVKKAGLDARDFITKGEKVEYTDKETGEKKSFTKDTIDFDTEGRESKRYQSRQLSEELSSANKEYSEARVAEIEQKAAEKKEFNKKAHVNENGRVTGVGESGKPNSYNPDIPEAREAYLKTNEGASSPVDAKKPFSFSKAMDVMEDAMEQSHRKGWTGKAGAALTIIIPKIKTTKSNILISPFYRYQW